jgi:hypothetical protein
MSDLLMKLPIPYTPKMTNRWMIRFKGNYKKLPSWVVSKTSRPRWEASITAKDMQIINTNSWSNMGGNWADIEIYLRDPIGTSTTNILMNAARIAGSTGISSKDNNNKIKYHLEMLDPTGVVVEKWKINGVVKSFDFGDLDYSNDSLVEIKMVIEPTKVVLL